MNGSVIVQIIWKLKSYSKHFFYTLTEQIRDPKLFYSSYHALKISSFVANIGWNDHHHTKALPLRVERAYSV